MGTQQSINGRYDFLKGIDSTQPFAAVLTEKPLFVTHLHKVHGIPLTKYTDEANISEAILHLPHNTTVLLHLHLPLVDVPDTTPQKLTETVARLIRETTEELPWMPLKEQVQACLATVRQNMAMQTNLPLLDGREKGEKTSTWISLAAVREAKLKKSKGTERVLRCVTVGHTTLAQATDTPGVFRVETQGKHPYLLWRTTPYREKEAKPLPWQKTLTETTLSVGKQVILATRGIPVDQVKTQWFSRPKYLININQIDSEEFELAHGQKQATVVIFTPKSK